MQHVVRGKSHMFISIFSSGKDSNASAIHLRPQRPGPTDEINFIS